MNIYEDYLKEIEARKAQGLHPKPIDGNELLSEIILGHKNYTVLPHRSKYYILILFLSLLEIKNHKYSYKIAFLKYTKAKYVLNYHDNYTGLVIPAKVTNSKLFHIQNGRRGEDCIIDFTKNIPNNWITGSVQKENDKYYNSMQYDGDFYNKQKLVPFTEFLPFESFFRLLDFNKLIPKNFFSEGKNSQDFNRKLLPSICYEGIFPMQILSKVTDDTLVIINISNDAWFGNYAGPKQHLTHVRYRTIESGLPMIRSTNKGYSVLVNPIGRVIESIPINELNFIEFKIPNRLDKTIYVKYGDWPVIILIALLFILLYILEITIFRKRSL